MKGGFSSLGEGSTGKGWEGSEGAERYNLTADEILKDSYWVLSGRVVLVRGRCFKGTVGNGSFARGSGKG